MSRPDREQFKIDQYRREWRDAEREPVVYLRRMPTEEDRREALALRFAKCFVVETP